MPIYLLLILAIIGLLLFGSEFTRWVAAGLLILGAWPVWCALRQGANQDAWRDVMKIVSSAEPPALPHPSVPAIDSQEPSADHR